MREIFQRHTNLIEPLSLDEAYLDVSENKMQLPTATRVAKMIREQIREELNLTASAGVAPNKFLAKIASDWKKPNGLFVIQPREIQSFLQHLWRVHRAQRQHNLESSRDALDFSIKSDLYTSGSLSRSSSIFPVWDRTFRIILVSAVSGNTSNR